MVGRHVGGGIDGRQFVLGGSDLVVLGLCHDPQLPKLVVQILHKFGDLRFDGAEIMIVHLLPLRRLGTEQRASGKAQVGALIIHLF